MDTVVSLFSFKRYEGSQKRVWDEFVDNSSNGTFLLKRDYMDYHSDRFQDYSILAYYKGKLRACLPANIECDATLISHGGLTYGGWIFPRAHFDGSKVLELFKAWIEWCREQKISRIIYKPVPWVISPMPAQEDLYALWRVGFSLRSRLLSSAIFPDNNPGFNMAKRQQLKEATTAADISVSESDNWDLFYDMLCSCLEERHDANPVHSLSELKLLHNRFPKNIRLFVAHRKDLPEQILAGTVIYDTGFTAHTQYMATNALGREKRALTYLISRLINNLFDSYRIFDFGTSNLPGFDLHSSLLEQKYSLGGRGAIYESYVLDL